MSQTIYGVFSSCMKIELPSIESFRASVLILRRLRIESLLVLAWPIDIHIGRMTIELHFNIEWVGIHLLVIIFC